ncbi:MAG: chromate transporter [Hymenobacter sp.]
MLLAFLNADLVQRFHWLSQGQLLDAVVVGQVTPGPVFTTATFVGYVLLGWRGALVATLGIFLPAFVFVGLSIAGGPAAPVAAGRGLPRRAERRVLGPDGGRFAHAGPHRAAGWADGGPFPGQRAAAGALQGQLGLAGTGGAALGYGPLRLGWASPGEAARRGGLLASHTLPGKLPGRCGNQAFMLSS